MMPESTSATSLSLEQFEERLLDGDRWVELTEGRFVRLNPPDDAHGDVVRNLSFALAGFLRKSTDTYACFELPLILERDPGTVRSPAVSCFRFHAEGRFAETDKVLTDTRPVLVVEVASSNERRDAIADRVKAYLNWGVEGVWVIDPVTRHVHQFYRQGTRQQLKEPQVLTGHPVLPGFAMPISDLFKQPRWVTAEKAPTDFPN